MASDQSNGLRRWSFSDVQQLQEMWPGATFRQIGHGPFSARVVRRRLPTVLIEGITATPYAVHRGHPEIERSPRSDLLLHVVLEGAGTVIRGSTRLEVHADDVFLLRLGSPFDYRCPVHTRTFRATVAEHLLPRGLRDTWDPEPKAVTPSQVSNAFLRLAEDLLADDCDLALPRSSAAHLDAALVALEQGVLAEELVRDPVAATSGSELRTAVLDHIEAHLGDPDLSPTALAERFSISLRSLHKLFEGLPETAAERIRRRRVEEAAAILRSRPMGAAELAAAVGFRSRETFQRAFQRQQGLTPTEYRALRSTLRG